MNTAALEPLTWHGRDGTVLHAVAAGSGDPVVVLHGPMADYRAVWPFITALAPRFRVIAPDLRGSGKSWYGEELSFALLADDLRALLDHLGAPQASVVGVSGGAGVLMRFALDLPHRLRALVAVTPPYAGASLGFTSHQKAIFSSMDAIASRALAEGIEVLRPLYAAVPEPFRVAATAMAMEFDPASVVASSRFLASGAQPFESIDELRSVQVPALVVHGSDPVHPAEVSAAYAAALPVCHEVAANDPQTMQRIAAFCAQPPR